jgi:hypothetical protein
MEMSTKKIIRTGLCLGAMLAFAALTGCASIVNGTNQVVSVETRAGSDSVSGASCKLQNDKGVYYVTTPGTVTVHRAYGDMLVTCDKSGMPTTTASFKSSTKGMLAGNIIFGGAIGAGVDMASGAAYDYPALLQIMMNDGITQATATTLPAPAATTPVSGGAN